jgi:hypothetical protein
MRCPRATSELELWMKLPQHAGSVFVQTDGWMDVVSAQLASSRTRGGSRVFSAVSV